MHNNKPLNKQIMKQSWQEAMSDLITDPAELLAIFQLYPALLPEAIAAARLFPLRAPRGYVARMEKGNPRDPLLLQVLPLGLELKEVAGFTRDPLKERIVNPVPGLLHKYESRVLISPTSACAVHCRYCFRRFFPYEDNNPGRAGWAKIVEYIQADARINEVIFSGGDPLTLQDNLLSQFVEMLSTIKHLRRIRFHTRIPVVLPERITASFLDWIQQLSLQRVIVIHTNHANEINAEVRAVLQQLTQAGVTLLNQSVILKGINDSIAAQVELNETLFAAGVIPYYLHVLDKVEGAAHFDIELADAQKLHADLVKALPGYLVPRLVREDAGEPAKTLLSVGQVSGKNLTFIGT